MRALFDNSQHEGGGLWRLAGLSHRFLLKPRRDRDRSHTVIAAIIHKRTNYETGFKEVSWRLNGGQRLPE